MNRTYVKNIIRTISGSFSRYIAILAIIALGVGFFAGLKSTKPSMVETGNVYFKEQAFYDFKAVSTIGFTDEEIERLSEIAHVKDAEGAFSSDFIYTDEEGNESVLKAISIPSKLNKLKLVHGRMPENPDECIIDEYQYGEDMIDSYVYVSDNNTVQTADAFSSKKYKVVGTAFSPLYLNTERGTTTLGNGRITGFVYIPEEGFNFDYYTEAYIKCDETYDIYTDEYNDYIEEIHEAIEVGVQEISELRTNMYPNLPKPNTYVTDREKNVGYVCFKNDSSIVESVAKVFPVFFFLIAALVCSTTMTRMVDDERGQIGTFRALGYSNAAIISKYLIYSGSAAIIGCSAGFMLGVFLFPYVIWKCYALLYGFAPIVISRSVTLFLLCLLVSLICSMGTTYLACKNELKCEPAMLIRPVAPAAGKRIWLEYIGFIWKRMKFLHKVTARNVFRFKKRMFMMIIGIAGCTALVITGFGLGDSISNIADFQYDEIDVHDIEMTYATEVDEECMSDIEDILGDSIERMDCFYKSSVDYVNEGVAKVVYLEAVSEDKIEPFENFNVQKGEKGYPGMGEVMISSKLASIADINVGDEITFSFGDNKSATLTVSQVYENYVWHYAYITPETYESYFGEAYIPNTVYINLSKAADRFEIGAQLSESEGVVNVLVIEELRQRVANMMKVMNSIVWLVIFCAGALAFIVLFNLSNINITERVREIATLKVIGFFPAETGAYVFRENAVLTLMGIVVGLPLGKLLHSFVMSKVQIDIISFKTVILPSSYLLSIGAVILFLVIVDLVMRRKIEAIDMAESLKSVE